MVSATEPGLRTRQTQFTRDLLMDALAGVIAEQGVTDFSVQDVADRARVSHRTVYRHFPTREALLAAFVPWAEERMRVLAGLGVPEHEEDVVPLLRRKFAALDELAPIVIPALQLEEGRAAATEQSARSLPAMRIALAESTAHLPPHVANVVTAVIRLIASSRTWLALRNEEGTDASRSADVVAWAVETLIGELRAGRGPGVNGS
jgi:AcrR family transcriptional regulator